MEEEDQDAARARADRDRTPQPWAGYYEAPALKPHVEREDPRRPGAAAPNWGLRAGAAAAVVLVAVGLAALGARSVSEPSASAPAAFEPVSVAELPMPAARPIRSAPAPAAPEREPSPAPIPAADLRRAPDTGGLERSDKVDGGWSGRYYYPGGSMPPVHFNITFTQIGDRILGQISEPNTFGGPGAPFLQADLVGTVSGGMVRFTKQYDGTGGVGHGVEYVGRLSPDGRSVAGTWTIAGSGSGAFEMRR